MSQECDMLWLSQCIMEGWHCRGHVGHERRLPGSLAFIRSATRPAGLYSDSCGSREGDASPPGKLWSE